MAKKDRLLLLPRGYLSWSQYVLWNRKDKTEYRRIYYYGGKSFSSKYTDFGSEVSEDGEHQNSDNETIRALNTLLPTYEYVEKKIDAYIQTPNGKLHIHGRLDTYEDTPRFRERKTGTRPWTKSKVASHGQIDFYYMLVYLHTGKLPTDTWLDHAETTVNENGEVELTGEIESHPANRTMEDVLRMIQKVTSAALEIEQDYKEHLALI